MFVFSYASYEKLLTEIFLCYCKMNEYLSISKWAVRTCLLLIGNLLLVYILQYTSVLNLVIQHDTLPPLSESHFKSCVQFRYRVKYFMEPICRLMGQFVAKHRVYWICDWVSLWRWKKSNELSKCNQIKGGLTK